VIFQDVTGVVAMERELRSAERMAAVGEMAAKIAHEIRNPLASISGSIQILADGIERDDSGGESGRLMDIVVRETDRLNALITDFLQYSRPAPPAQKTVGVGALLDEILELLEAARPQNVRLHCTSPEDLAVHADPDQVKQVLWNLCLNALQSMPEGGAVTISARHVESGPPQAIASFRRNGGLGAQPEICGSRRWVEIAIRDEGVGIPADVQERIFEPFFTTKRDGTGLGLATVHRIVESHAGGLLLSSEEGAGTTFRVLLPGSEEQA
jgi:two-component system sensor histidine kinase PilS (NtrC family)